MRVFKHNKTGKLYKLVQENLLFKDKFGHIPNGHFEWKFEWRKSDNLILYKALYDNPDGPYFVRHAEDFFSAFTEVPNDNIKN